MSGNWLEAFLDDAKAKNLCVRCFCTTCGALPFRRTLVGAAAAATGRARADHAWDNTIAVAATAALAELAPATVTRHFDALRLVLVDLWGGLGEERFHRLTEAPLGIRPRGVCSSGCGYILPNARSARNSTSRPVTRRRKRRRYGDTRGQASMLFGSKDNERAGALQFPEKLECAAQIRLTTMNCAIFVQYYFLKLTCACTR